MAKRTKSGLLTLGELAIMHVLWEHGPSTVQQVRLNLKGEPAYTTVQTMLNILTTKANTARNTVGKTYVYHPTLSRQRARETALQDMIDRWFLGSADAFVNALLETRAKELQSIQTLLKN